nr:YfcE family phosphodiesterase [Anaerolineae bacterium]
MLVAVCSDIHDNIWRLEAALPAMSRADALLFCGDFCAPFTLSQLARGFEGPIHAVFGNNDGDQRLLLQVAGEVANVTLHGQFADLSLGGWRIALTHYPEIGKAVAQGGVFDLVCYGHDHLLHQEAIGRTLLINPGELMGRFGRSTFNIVNFDDRSVRVVDVE